MVMSGLRHKSKQLGLSFQKLVHVSMIQNHSVLMILANKLLNQKLVMLR